jgi:hypothetical protein
MTDSEQRSNGVKPQFLLILAETGFDLGFPF